MSLLFCDVVGSTALLTRLGDIEGGEVRRNYLAALRGAVADAAGVEVKNLGDGRPDGVVRFAQRCAALRGVGPTRLEVSSDGTILISSTDTETKVWDLEHRRGS